MPLDRTPIESYAEGLTAGRSRRLGPVEVSYTLVSSQYIKDLLYSGPKASGIIARTNNVHRSMANEVGLRARENYIEARRNRPNKRRDASRHGKMMRELDKMSGFGRPVKGIKGLLGARTAGAGEGRGSVVFRSAAGARGIRGGTGFKVDFTKLDEVVLNTETEGQSFPYWRSLEFGYGSFIADRPLFSRTKSGVGPFSPPTSFASDDPRMPQGFGHAPYESVKIRAFGGYGMFEKAIRSVYSGSEGFTSSGSLWYYPQMLLRQRALPKEWVLALEGLQAGQKLVTRGDTRVIGRSASGKFLPKGSDPRF